MSLLDKLERKIGWLAIPNLIYYIIVGNIMVYVTQMLMSVDLTNTLAFDRSMILKGQVWRLFSFVFIPPSTFDGSIVNLLFAVLIFLFYFSIGRKTEMVMGSFAFTIYYLVGMLGVILSGMIFPMSLTGAFLNTALFFAYAYYFPDDIILFMMILPVKIKYLAYISGAAIFIQFLLADATIKVIIVSGLLNFLVFFGKPLIIERLLNIKIKKRQRDYRRMATKSWGVEPKVYSGPYRSGKKTTAKHCCGVCGRTEQSNPDLEFRYCSQCEGYHEYCMEHLHGHKHIKSGEA